MRVKESIVGPTETKGRLPIGIGKSTFDIFFKFLATDLIGNICLLSGHLTYPIIQIPFRNGCVIPKLQLGLVIPIRVKKQSVPIAAYEIRRIPGFSAEFVGHPCPLSYISVCKKLIEVGEKPFVRNRSQRNEPRL